MSVAVVVAAGSFVGRHLCRCLRARGVEVVEAGRSGANACDLHEPATVEALLAARPRWLFSCAGATARQPESEQFRLHEGGTRTLLETAARLAPEAVVTLFGSAAEYGPVDDLPVSESCEPRPTSSYGRSKLAQTRLAAEIAESRGLRVQVVRPFNLLGPGLGVHYFTGALCARLRAMPAGEVPISNGAATRDWIDVRDVAEAVAALSLDAPPGRGECVVYNAATGVETSVLELARELCRAAGDFVAVDEGRGVSRTGIDRSCGDASRLRARVGWRPRIDWRESARDTWAASV